MTWRPLAPVDGPAWGDDLLAYACAPGLPDGDRVELRTEGDAPPPRQAVT